jgi:glycosyltransferase involved in cell wall biosynthesis
MKARASLKGEFTLSVVIPTYNRGGLLHNCVESVLNQSVKADRIIIVDNGEYRCYQNLKPPKEVEVICVKTDIGASRARNIGLELVQTEYVAFLDDDDIWDSNFIKEMKVEISKNKCTAYVGSLFRISIDSKDKYKYKTFPSELSQQRRVYFSNPGFGGQNIVVNTDFMKKIGGFDLDFPGSEDRDLAARILENKKTICSVPNAIAILCDHSGDRLRLNKGARSRLLFISKHYRRMSIVEICYAFIKIFDYLQRSVRNSTKIKANR